MFRLIKMILDLFSRQNGGSQKIIESHEQQHTIPAFEAKELYDHKNDPKSDKESAMSAKSINQKGIDLLKKSEGLELRAYRDSVNVLTIGYGHTGADVSEDQEISNEEAEELLRGDLAKFEAGVSKAVKVIINDNQFSALVVFSYNVGLGNLQSSTLLRKLNLGDSAGAAEEFLRWNKAGGKVLAGLTTRRASERALFLSPVA